MDPQGIVGKCAACGWAVDQTDLDGEPKSSRDPLSQLWRVASLKVRVRLSACANHNDADLWVQIRSKNQ